MFGAIKNFLKTESMPQAETELYETFFKLKDGNLSAIKALHVALLQMWGIFKTKYNGITDFAYKEEAEKFEYLDKILAMEKDFAKIMCLTESLACTLLRLVLANTFIRSKKDIDKVVRVRAIFEHFRETGVIEINAYPDPDKPRVHVHRR
jgi:hypothetical protein